MFTDDEKYTIVLNIGFYFNVMRTIILFWLFM